MHRISVHLATSLVLLAFAVLGLACTGDDFDRDDAIRRVIDQSSGAVTAEQAACYVDRVRDEIGTEPLQPDGTIPADQVERAAAIRVDCIGVSSLGNTSSSSVGTTAPSDVGGVPRSFGDDPELDALWTRCAEGYGADCDLLFERAPLDSAYERFGASCGDRTREMRCADVYPSPGVTLPSPAQPPTT